MEKNLFNTADFTLRAEYPLHHVEENQQLQEAIHAGDLRPFNEIMEHILENKLTWGDHIKRYIYMALQGGYLDELSPQTEQYGDMEDITREELIHWITELFEHNGMKNRGSIDPKVQSSVLSKNLKRWLDSPVTKIHRNTCFLFAFGLNMSEEDADYMLNVLRQPGFNPRDYKEAIYYYCLRNNLKYVGVEQWLQSCESWKEELANSEQKKEEYLPTKILWNELKQISALVISSVEKDRLFADYLKKLLAMPSTGKRSQTRARVYQKLYDDFSQSFSEQAMFWYEQDKVRHCYDDFERSLREFPTESVTISDTVRKLVEEGLLDIPSLTASSLEKKIGGEQSVDISREDILTMAFLCCSNDFPEQGEEQIPYTERKDDFLNWEETNLEECGFGEFYMLNPYELFLVSCLLQPNPLQYYLAVWKLIPKRTRG